MAGPGGVFKEPVPLYRRRLSRQTPPVPAFFALRPLAAALCLLLAPLPHAGAWDHAATDAIRSQMLDAAVTAALPGYTFANVGVAGRSVWYYYNAPGQRLGVASLELQLSFHDGEPVKPLVNCWEGDPAIFGPVADFVGDEAIAYDGSRSQPPTNGHWIRARVGGRNFFLRANGEPFVRLTALAQALAPALPKLPVPASFEIEPSEREQPKPEYLELDRAMFARVTPKLLADPPDLSALSLRPPTFETADLGFGYRVETGGAGGGYLSLYASLLLRDDEREALRVGATLPRSPAPPELYAELFRPLFGDRAHHASDSAARYWQYGRAAEPLDTAALPIALPVLAPQDDDPDQATLAWLMAPFSGTGYGTRGGYAGGQLPNRRAWSSLSRLDAPTCLYLLRSKNPATRLTAVETLRRHADAWQVDLAVLAPTFDLIYQNPATIQTLQGCIIRQISARQLVDAAVASPDPMR